MTAEITVALPAPDTRFPVYPYTAHITPSRDVISVQQDVRALEDDAATSFITVNTAPAHARDVIISHAPLDESEREFLNAPAIAQIRSIHIIVANVFEMSGTDDLNAFIICCMIPSLSTLSRTFCAFSGIDISRPHTETEKARQNDMKNIRYTTGQRLQFPVSEADT